MPEYAAFLRGMNVGGHRLSNAELGACFEKLGLNDVNTFRASGNVVFAAKAEPIGKLSARIEAGLLASLGYEVPVFLRSAGEMRSIASQQPFAESLIEASQGKLQVVLLAIKPSAKARKQVQALASDDDDLLAFHTRELHWLPSGGILDSALDWKQIEKLLGQMTTRTKGTIEQLSAKYFAV